MVKFTIGECAWASRRHACGEARRLRRCRGRTSDPDGCPCRRLLRRPGARPQMRSASAWPPRPAGAAGSSLGQQQRRQLLLAPKQQAARRRCSRALLRTPRAGRRLMDKKDNIRNMSVIAHVDHGELRGAVRGATAGRAARAVAVHAWPPAAMGQQRPGSRPLGAVWTACGGPRVAGRPAAAPASAAADVDAAAGPVRLQASPR